MQDRKTYKGKEADKMLRSGAAMTIVGFDDDGKALWAEPERESSTRWFGPNDAGLNDIKRKGVPVREGFTKRLPGGWHPSQRSKYHPRAGWKNKG